MNDNLFEEPNDKLQAMIYEAVKDAMNEHDEPEPGGYLAIARLTSEITDTFEKSGYNRKESVYLTGQLINGLCGFLGGQSL